MPNLSPIGICHIHPFFVASHVVYDGVSLNLYGTCCGIARSMGRILDVSCQVGFKCLNKTALKPEASTNKSAS